MRRGVRHAGRHSRVGPAAYLIATLQKDQLKRARPGGGVHLSLARAAVAVRPLSFPPSSARLSLPDCTFSVCGGYLLLASDVTFMPICSIVYLCIYPAGICRSPARASTCEAPGCDGEQTQLWVSFQLACGRHVISKSINRENKG